MRACSAWGYDVFHKAGVLMRRTRRGRLLAAEKAHESVSELMAAANESHHVHALIYRSAGPQEPAMFDHTGGGGLTLSEAGLSILGYLCKCRRSFLPRELEWIKRYKALTVEITLAREV